MGCSFGHPEIEVPLIHTGIGQTGATRFRVYPKARNPFGLGFAVLELRGVGPSFMCVIWRGALPLARTSLKLTHNNCLGFRVCNPYQTPHPLLDMKRRKKEVVQDLGHVSS